LSIPRIKRRFRIGDAVVDNLQTDEAPLQGRDYRLRAIVHIQPHNNGRDVTLHSGFGDAEQVPNLLSYCLLLSPATKRGKTSSSRVLKSESGMREARAWATGGGRQKTASRMHPLQRLDQHLIGHSVDDVAWSARLQGTMNVLISLVSPS
jgi:hypothetical protein